MAQGGRRIKKDVPTDYNIIRKMNVKDRINIAQTLAKRANVRMKTLSNSKYKDNYMMKQVKHYLSQQGLNSFYQGKEYDSISKLNYALMQLTHFINAKTSTVRGNVELEKQRFKKFSENHKLIDKLKKLPENKGLKRKEVIEKYQDSFYEFLRSSQYKDLLTRYTSEDIMDDFALALMQGHTLEEISEQYLEEQVNEKMTFEQVAEKYHRAKWQLEEMGVDKLQ